MKIQRPSAGAPAPRDTHETLLADLYQATAKGRGHADWLSFAEAKQLLGRAERAGPEVRAAFQQSLTRALETARVDDHPLVLGGRAMDLVCAFTGVKPEVYLKAAGQTAEVAQAARSAALQRLESASAAQKVTSPARLDAQAGLAKTMSQALGGLARAARRSDAPLTDVDAANARAAEALAEALADRGVSSETVALRFAREDFSPSDFDNPRQLARGIEQAAGFLAQMVKDAPGTKLEVQLSPRGQFERRYGENADTLHVPLNAGDSARELREKWDAGEFIPVKWWNPFDKGRKLRAVWKLVGNPVGPVRTRMRRLLGRSAAELTGGIARALEASGPELREGAEALIRRFVGADFQRPMLERVAQLDEAQVVQLLEGWRITAGDPALLEETSEGLSGAALNSIKDQRRTFGLVNVDTYDSVAVRDPVLQRHAGPALNEVELTGTRVGLVNVSSVDVVTVMPNLARMIFGGVALERALEG